MLDRNLLPTGPIEHLGLEEDHRIVPGEGGSEQPLGIDRGGWADHDEAGRVDEIRLG